MLPTGLSSIEHGFLTLPLWPKILPRQVEEESTSLPTYKRNLGLSENKYKISFLQCAHFNFGLPSVRHNS